MTKEHSAYITLNLRKGATDEQVKESYLTLVKRFDPERHTDRFMIIQKAFERLSDPVKRAKEDILTFNPTAGRFQFLEEEKENLTEAQIADEVSRCERLLTEGNGSDPDYEAFSMAQMLRSAFYIRRKQYQKSIESWERILQIDPTHQRAKNNLIFAYSTLAYSYAEHELYDEAVDLWVKASLMNPDDNPTIHNLALACEFSGHKEDSERYWGETLRRWKAELDRDPDNAYLRNCILEAHRHHGGRSLEKTIVGQPAQEAIQEYKEILKIDPEDFEAQFQIAVSHMNDRQWNEAIEAFKTLLRKHPRNVEALNLFGWALLNSGQIDAAFQMWRRSLETDPKNSSTREAITRAHLELGKKCRDQGQYNTALKHFKQLQKMLGARNPEIHFEIGRTYFLKGDRRAAYMEFQTVMNLDPKNQAAKKLLQELRMR